MLNKEEQKRFFELLEKAVDDTEYCGNCSNPKEHCMPVTHDSMCEHLSATGPPYKCHDCGKYVELAATPSPKPTRLAEIRDAVVNCKDWTIAQPRTDAKQLLDIIDKKNEALEETITKSGLRGMRAETLKGRLLLINCIAKSALKD